jgi:hypothetical protein
VEEELHYLRVQMQAVESYSSYDKHPTTTPGAPVRSSQGNEQAALSRGPPPSPTGPAGFNGPSVQ